MSDDKAGTKYLGLLREWRLPRTSRGLRLASGDSGSSGVGVGRPDEVNFPASSPYALACGGTTLTASGGSIEHEVTSNYGAGGVSAKFGCRHGKKIFRKLALEASPRR